MHRITANPDGTFTLPAGSYALASDREGHHVTHETTLYAFWLCDIVAPELITDIHGSGIDVLRLPLGKTRFGTDIRTIEIGDGEIVASTGLCIFPVDEEDAAAIHGDGQTVFELTADTVVAVKDGVILIGETVIDPAKAGIYHHHSSAAWVIVDMDEPGLAGIIGYEPDAILDEHGLRVYIRKGHFDGDEKIAALRALGTPTALALAAEAETNGLECFGYGRLSLLFDIP